MEYYQQFLNEVLECNMEDENIELQDVEYEKFFQDLTQANIDNSVFGEIEFR